MNLILLVGPPGSGKSTLATELHGAGYSYVNQDKQKKEHLQYFQRFLSENRDIVVDRLNFNKEQRDRYLKPAKEARYTTKIIVLHENKEICLQRCLDRKDHETIKDEENAQSALNMFFSKYERVTDDEADLVERRYPAGIKLEALICDLDGTLCNINHRLHHVKGERKNWKLFFEEMVNDTPNDWCDKLLDGFNNDEYSEYPYIILCSGRPDSYRKTTEEWLKKHYIQYDNLFMRHRQDHRQDYIAKENILDFEILTRYKPILFIDDRKQVVDMWRRRGYTCLQCDEGEF